MYFSLSANAFDGAYKNEMVLSSAYTMTVYKYLLDKRELPKKEAVYYALATNMALTFLKANFNSLPDKHLET